MQVFEFHFNPKVRPDLIFDSFCFEPENIYEKRVGSLYMIGFLKNVLPQNSRFLDNLARAIRERYYKFTLKNPEKALKESLKTANDFLEEVAKKGDVSWLGNLSWACLSLKNFELNFTKVGEIKILLLRKGQIIDIDKRLKFQDIEPYPLKVFPNIVSGKLAENDILLVLTKEVFNSFQEQNLITEIAQTSPFGGKGVKETFRRKNEELSKIFGVCLLIYLSKGGVTESRKIISPAKIYRSAKKFSLKIIFSPLISPIKKFINLRGKKRFFKMPRLKLPKLFAPFSWNKNLTLILILIFFLFFGFFISQKEENQKLKSYQATFNQIQEKTDRAESLLILKETNPATKKQVANLFEESWEEISPLVKISSTFPKYFKEQVSLLSDKISGNLFELNKLTIIEEPELVFEVKQKDFVSTRIISNGKNLYLFNPFSQNLLKVSPSGLNEIISTEKKFNLSTKLEETILFFSKPNKISILKGEGISEISLPTPNWDYSFERISSFNSNLYFWDRKTSQIVKYPYLGNFSWGEPEKWLLPQTKKAVEINSVAVDGNIWLIDKNNLIDRYYASQFQETLILNIFPAPKDFIKILVLPKRGTTSPLYLLEPAQKRIVILDKNGGIIRQFQSKKFDELLDFSVSDDGKIIYLLNGQKVYKISE